MGMLVDLAAAAAGSGLPVVEVAGWRTRGHGPMSSVQAIVCHHTAGPAAGDAPSLAVVRDGRPDLAGPLAHLVLARSGTVHVVAAGLCWHAGATLQPWQANAHAVGIEAEATGRDPWPDTQYAAYVRLCRALADHYGVPYSRVLGHKEICKPAGRKSDPNFSMSDFRAALGAAGPAGPDALPRLAEGDVGDDVLHWQTWLVSRGASIDLDPRRFGPQTVKATAAFQREAGVTGPDADGRHVGPRTLRAAWDEGFRG